MAPSSSAAPPPRRRATIKTSEIEIKRRRTSAALLTGGHGFGNPTNTNGGGNGNDALEEPAEEAMMSEKIQKVLATWESKQASFDEQILWDGKLKSRVFNGLSKALEDGANKIIGEESEYLQGIAKDMLDFTEKAKSKFDLFQKIRKNVRESVVNLTEDDQRILMSLRNGKSLIPKIMMHCCSTLLKEIEEKGVGGM